MSSSYFEQLYGDLAQGDTEKSLAPESVATPPEEPELPSAGADDVKVKPRKKDKRSNRQKSAAVENDIFSDTAPSKTATQKTNIHLLLEPELVGAIDDYCAEYNRAHGLARKRNKLTISVYLAKLAEAHLRESGFLTN